MMSQDKLRRADIFSGAIICLFGLWVVSQALKMPMKDSWGAVLNVWFVSPALFFLFVGGMIALLGALLVPTALKTAGKTGPACSRRWAGFAVPNWAAFCLGPVFKYLLLVPMPTEKLVAGRMDAFYYGDY